MNMEELQEQSLSSYVQVQTDNPQTLYEILKAEGAQADITKAEKLRVRKIDLKDIGDIAFEHGLRIYELVIHQPSLEELFAELATGKSEYRGSSYHESEEATQ